MGLLNRAPVRRGDGDAAVSSVVAAVLVFALVTMATAVWTAVSLPDWIAEKESSHQNGVRDDLAALQAGLDRLAATGDVGPVAETVRLGARPVPLFQSAPSSGELSVDGTFNATASFTGARLLWGDGVLAGSVDVPVTTSQDGIRDLLGLRLALTTSGVTASRAATTTLALTSGTTSITAALVHRGSTLATACDGAEVLLQVTTPAGTTEQPLLCGVGDGLVGYSVDLLGANSELPVALSYLDPPFVLTGSTSVSSGTGTTVSGLYQAVWLDEEGRVRAAGSGADASGFGVAHEGSSLVFDPSYRHFEDQEAVWEGGALLAVQPEVQAVQGEPAFSLAVDGTTGLLDWTIVRLEGDGTVQGTGLAQVEVRRLRTTDVVLTADGATFTLEGAHGDAWRAFLQAQVDAAGTSDATVGGSGGTATLTLDDTTVGSWVLRLRLLEARVQVR